MKKWLVVSAIVILIAIGAFYGLSYYGVKLINNELQRRLGPGITIAEMRIKLTHLYGAGVRYEDPTTKRELLRIEEIRIYPALLSAIKGELRIREVTLVRPWFFFHRSQSGAWTAPWPAGEEKNESRGTRQIKRGASFAVKIDRIRVEDGALAIEDGKVEGPPAEIHFNRLNLDLGDIQYPFASVRSSITLKGKMVGANNEGVIETTGWIDFSTLDMDTVLTVREVDVKNFEPYYRRRVSAEIQSGYMSLQSKINIRQKMIDGPGTLELSRFYVREGGGSVLWIPTTTLVSLLRNRGNRIKVEFHVEGKIDDPRFSLQENVMRRLAISLAESLGVPVKIVGEEMLRGTFKGVEGLAEGLKSLQDLFSPPREKRK